MVPIPEDLLDLFQRPILCALATLMSDGQPQVTPVWCDYNGQYVRINTRRGRQKDRNMTRHAKVTLFLLDPNDHYRWLEVRGQIADITEDGANEHINQLSHKYEQKDFRALNPSEVRVMYKIEPLRVNKYE